MINRLQDTLVSVVARRGPGKLELRCRRTDIEAGTWNSNLGFRV